MVKQTILKDGSVEIGYEDGSSRTIPIIQHFYELYLTRELMPHEFVRYKDPNKRGLDLTGIELMVRHPDWPEVKDVEPVVAQPLDTIYRTVASYGKRNGRKSIQIFWNKKDRTKMSLARFKMQQSLKRKLLKSEQVDHIDEDKTNDDISNLQILSIKKNVEKNHLHRGNRIGEDKYGNFNCKFCEKKFTRLIKQTKGQENVFCSETCAATHTNRKRFEHLEKIVNLICPCCSKEFIKDAIQHRTLVNQGQKFFFCSRDCADASINLTWTKGRAETITCSCTYCKTEFQKLKKEVKRSLKNSKHGLFCGHSCVMKYIHENIKKTVLP